MRMSVDLDPDRQAAATQRVAALLEAAADHRAEAAALEARAVALTRSWDLPAAGVDSDGERA